MVDNHITNFGQAHNIAVNEDTANTDREICVASNEDTVTVLDVTDGLAYQSNYTSGLRVNDDTGFAGTWGNYPYFDSGTVVVTGIEEGLFVLKPRVKSSDN